MLFGTDGGSAAGGSEEDEAGASLEDWLMAMLLNRVEGGVYVLSVDVRFKVRVRMLKRWTSAVDEVKRRASEDATLESRLRTSQRSKLEQCTRFERGCQPSSLALVTPPLAVLLSSDIVKLSQAVVFSRLSLVAAAAEWPKSSLTVTWELAAAPPTASTSLTLRRVLSSSVVGASRLRKVRAMSEGEEANGEEDSLCS